MSAETEESRIERMDRQIQSLQEQISEIHRAMQNQANSSYARQK